MMSDEERPDGGGFSRRELLRRASMLGVALNAIPLLQIQGLRRAPLETLTPAEGDTLHAIVARIIPSDGNGPGAAEAGAARYIDRALGGALSGNRELYRSGLAAVDRYAQAAKGAPFAALAAADQDAVLTDMENNVATGFTPAADVFFNLVRAHTIQGTFCDPYYGGNVNFAGWDLIGYPGIRLAASAGDQRLDARPSPTHRSAYDHAMFAKRPPSRSSIPGEMHPHGD
jgi:gluconate 2-dehydrogenase gamma chain